MSSHHFVKEGQEPALFIIDPFSLAQIEPLLEWAPLVMVLDTGLDTVLSWGIKIDVVLAETNNIELISEKAIEQFPIKIRHYQFGQEPLSVGLHILSTQQTAVHIISTITENVFKEAQAFAEKLSIAILDRKVKWSFITSGVFEKWLPAHTKLSLRKRNENAQSFNFHGLNTITETELESSADGKVIINSESSFWIGEAMA